LRRRRKLAAQGRGAQPLAAIAIGVCRRRALGKADQPRRASTAPARPRRSTASRRNWRSCRCCRWPGGWQSQWPL